MRNQIAPFLILLTACSSLPLTYKGERAPARSSSLDKIDDVSFFSTPEDLHQTWLDLLKTAKVSILMEMFHLTDLDVVQALRALPASVEINLILDSVNLKSVETEKIKDAILIDRPNIHVFPSSGPPGGFNQTHTKAIIIDGKFALITSINLTNNAAIQRDYGIKTEDPEIIDEMTKVFNADIQNSKNAEANLEPTRFTPDVGKKNLIWSPVNSESALVSLINESIQIPAGPNKFISTTVENLGDKAIEAALSNAAKNHVQVRIMVPQCVLGANGSRNYDFFQTLKDGVQLRVMPYPSSRQQPYLHGKMIVLGNGRSYIGSVNFSNNSTQGNRELGIIFLNPKISKQISSIFDQDWQQAVEVSDPSNKPNCPTNTSSPAQ